LPEETSIHTQIGAYVLRALGRDERQAFEAHLAGCQSCQRELGELREVAGLLTRAAPAYPLPSGLRERTFAAVERAAVEDGAATAPSANGHRGPVPRSARRAIPRPRPRFRLTLPRLGLVAGGAAALAAAVFAGVQISERSRDLGPPEVVATLTGDGDSSRRAGATVIKTGIGRVIEFRTDDLPILPKKDYYELWFVGPGDTPQRPNRISAGTFHPDPQGRSNVTFAAAVEPRKYPKLSVTREKGDGNPQRGGPEVLSTEE
jgi:hypothetical protein